MTVQKRNGSPRRGSRHAWQGVLFSVALGVVLAGYLKVHAGSIAPIHPLQLAEKVAAELAEEYRAIRASGLDGALPPMPPSEAWPSQ